MYRASERIHLTRDGKLCKPGDKRSRSLLVPKFGELSDKVAESYGLSSGRPVPWVQDEKEDGALPLDSRPAQPQQPQQATTSAPALQTEGEPQFREHIQLGTPPPAAAESVPPVPPAQETQLQESPSLETSAPQPIAAEPTGSSDLPDDFPYKMILVAANLSTKEQLKAATKDQLITVPQIGSARADEILAAREKF